MQCSQEIKWRGGNPAAPAGEPAGREGRATAVQVGQGSSHPALQLCPRNLEPRHCLIHPVETVPAGVMVAWVLTTFSTNAPAPERGTFPDSPWHKGSAVVKEWDLMKFCKKYCCTAPCFHAEWVGTGKADRGGGGEFTNLWKKTQSCIICCISVGLYPQNPRSLFKLQTDYKNQLAGLSPYYPHPCTNQMKLLL